MRILVHDLSGDTVRRIENRMLPGQDSDTGFLALRESLTEVVERDAAVLTERGIVPEDLAARLAALLGEARAQYDATGRVPRDGIVVDGRYRFFGFDVIEKGIQSCPFETNDGRRCDGHEACRTFGAQYYAVVNDARGSKFGFPVLALHLIRDHHFFGGGVEFRVDPETAARTLDL